MASVMAVMKQKNIRQAEKTLREMLDKADKSGDGKVELEEFIRILESNNVEIDKNEMTQLRKLCSERGDVSKSDLVGFIKQSKIWKGIMESKAKTCTQPQPIAKVGDRTKVVKTAFRMLDLDKDGYITKDEFSQASKTLDAEQIEIVFKQFDTNKDGRLRNEANKI